MWPVSSQSDYQRPTILSSMPQWIAFLLLCLLSLVHAAFTGTTCDAAHILCVERTGSVCFYSNVSTPLWGCNTPFELPLEAHLNQNYSIGHYSASGQHLGGWNYSLIGSTPPIYACMSARVNITSAEYLTLCAVVTADNTWEVGGCVVNVVPASVVDGCYTGVSDSILCSPTFSLTEVRFVFLKPNKSMTSTTIMSIAGSTCVMVV